MTVTKRETGSGRSHVTTPRWLVGASYDATDDQTDRFVADGIWKNGYKDKYLDVVRSKPSEQEATKRIYQLARYQVRPEALEKCLSAVHEFVAYVRRSEPGTLRYDVWQEQADPTRFVHAFIFRDEAADKAHSESAEVKKFASVLYPQCLAPVEFVDYTLVASNK